MLVTNLPACGVSSGMDDFFICILLSYYLVFVTDTNRSFFAELSLLLSLSWVLPPGYCGKFLSYKYLQSYVLC